MDRTDPLSFGPKFSEILVEWIAPSILNFKSVDLGLIKKPRGTPYNGLYGEAPPERGTFFRPQVYKRVGILLVEVYGRVGKSVIFVCEKAQHLTDALLFFCWGGGRGYPDNGLTFYSGGVPNSYNEVGVSCYETKFSSSRVELPALK